MQLDVKALGVEIGALIAEMIAPLQKRIEELEARQPERGERGDAGPQGIQGERGEAGDAGEKGDPGDRGEKGEQGEPGVHGRDAEPLLVADVVAELLSTKALEPILDMMAVDAIAKHFEANPVQHGRDGKDGERGLQGERGEKGDTGADGVGYAGEFIDRDGNLTLTKENGQVTKLGVVVGRDGKDGAPGRDGLSMADVSRSYDPEAHEVVERWTVAGEQKELRYAAGGIRPGGFWREGMKCFAGQAVTHNGSLWIAKRDTAAKPCLENADDWQLAARQGRDGRDGKDGKPPPGPISLKGDDDA